MRRKKFFFRKAKWVYIIKNWNKKWNEKAKRTPGREEGRKERRVDRRPEERSWVLGGGVFLSLSGGWALAQCEVVENCEDEKRRLKNYCWDLCTGPPLMLYYPGKVKRLEFILKGTVWSMPLWKWLWEPLAVPSAHKPRQEGSYTWGALLLSPVVASGWRDGAKETCPFNIMSPPRSWSKVLRTPDFSAQTSPVDL